MQHLLHSPAVTMGRQDYVSASEHIERHNLKAPPCPYRDVCSVTRKHQAGVTPETCFGSHRLVKFCKVVALSMQLAVVSCFPGASQACLWGPPLLTSGVKLLGRSGDAFYKLGHVSHPNQVHGNPQNSSRVTNLIVAAPHSKQSNC